MTSVPKRGSRATAALFTIPLQGLSCKAKSVFWGSVGAGMNIPMQSAVTQPFTGSLINYPGTCVQQGHLHETRRVVCEAFRDDTAP